MLKKILNYAKYHSSYIFILIILSIINLIIAFTFFDLPQYPPWDRYGDATRFVNGENIIVSNNTETDKILSRILNSSFIVFTSAYLEPVFGNPDTGMLVINIILYFLIIYFYYGLVYLIYEKRKIAFYSSLFLVGHYCMYNYVAGYGSDAGGWFFMLLSSFFALKYYKQNQEKYYYLSILSAIVGFMFKETGVLGMATLGMVILFEDAAIKDKVQKIFKATVLFLIIPILYYLIFYYYFDYSYFNWFDYNIETQGSISFFSLHRIKELIKQSFYVYMLGGIPFLYGLIYEKKEYSKKRIKLLISLLPASLAFLVWPALITRIMFIVVPFLAMISGFGIYKMKNKYFASIFVVFYLVVNFYLNPIMETINYYIFYRYF